MPRKKIFVLDTNVLMAGADSLFSYGIHDVAIPIKVLEELDKNKGLPSEAGFEARNAIRHIKDIINTNKNRRIGKRKGLLLFPQASLFEGDWPTELSLSSPDNLILKTACGLRDSSDQDIIFVSNDVNMVIKAKSLDLVVEGVSGVEKTRFQLESGVTELTLTHVEIEELYRNNLIHKELDENPNQCLVLTSDFNSNQTALAIYRNKKITLARKYDKKNKHFFQNINNTLSGGGGTKARWVQPKNKEQTFSYDILMDKSIPMVTLVGQAGTGKTLLAVSAGLYQTVETEDYRKIMITRPVQPMGREIGFLPGSLEEKMSPWLNPIKDNLEYMLGDRLMVEDLFAEGLIEVESLSYIRGRSISDTFIIIDESQNLSKHEIKTIVTRIGHGSKIVFTGDIEQIDNERINEESNGLTYLIEKFKTEDLAGHITLKKCERSPLAAIAAKIL